MADTVVFQTNAATPPDGTVVSTEEVTTLNGSAVTAQQVQRILLALRTGDGVAIDLPGDAANGLKVQSSSLSLPSGAATAANQATEIASLASIDGKITTVNTGAVVVSSSALPSGAATAANQSTEQALVGGVTETAPATDTASSGLNGRLQRIAQRLTSLIALLPASLGQKTMANSLAVVLASDQASIPVASTLQAGSATVGAVTDAGPSIEGTSTYTTSANMTTAADIGPVPTSGQKSILLQACISVDTAMSITLQMETTPGSERVKFFLPANGSIIFIPRYPKKLGTADKKWQAIASASGNVAISTTTRSEA